MAEYLVRVVATVEGWVQVRAADEARAIKYAGGMVMARQSAIESASVTRVKSEQAVRVPQSRERGAANPRADGHHEYHTYEDESGAKLFAFAPAHTRAASEVEDE